MRNHCDIPTLMALQGEWQRHPPVHHLVAAYLGHKPPAARTAQACAPEADINELIAELGDVPVRKAAPVDSAAFEAAMKELTHGRQ